MIAAIADTHTVIWYIFSDARLGKSAKNFIDTTANNGDQIGISSITLIEMIYLIEKGRIASESFSRLANALDDSGNVFNEIPVDLKIARALSQVDAGQIPDMPDRIVAATAVQYNVPVISRDGKIKLSSVQTIW
jgi:PIN domain nuclease of toxin-antitoxin system